MGIDANKRQELFTYSNDAVRTGARMHAQCPDKTCERDNAVLNFQVGRTRDKLELQCDEFPWKSSEQGGEWMDQLGPGRQTATCVPAYQINWHGQCMSKLTLFDLNEARDSQKRELWAIATQTSQGQVGEEGAMYTQRTKEYPTKQPPPDGVPTRPDGKYSWVFKRDYTVSWLNQGSVSASDWWGATTWDYAKADYGKNPGGAESIICAINIFGQDDVYKYPYLAGAKSDYNGLCVYSPKPGQSNPKNGYFSTELTYRHCKVEFAPVSSSGNNAKRDWQVTNVTILDEGPENLDGN
ncbi:hypothetical protein BJY00DRAFT_318010 [Aspergillus carlsbadensis]|nr:hypothetical protein BJY00DRAFT_318010 [Aspergillus carlsbadensis]